jgi:hypothetical protein
MLLERLMTKPAGVQTFFLGDPVAMAREGESKTKARFAFRTIRKIR